MSLKRNYSANGCWTCKLKGSSRHSSPQHHNAISDSSANDTIWFPCTPLIQRFAIWKRCKDLCKTEVNFPPYAYDVFQKIIKLISVEEFPNRLAKTAIYANFDAYNFNFWSVIWTILFVKCHMRISITYWWLEHMFPPAPFPSQVFSPWRWLSTKNFMIITHLHSVFACDVSPVPLQKVNVIETS